MVQTPSTPAAAGSRLADTPARPPCRPSGRVRRFFEGVDGVSQAIDAVVVVGRVGWAVLRGLGGLFRAFD